MGGWTAAPGQPFLASARDGRRRVNARGRNRFDTAGHIALPAGGFREFANQKKVVIIRRGGARFTFNYKEVVAGKKLQQNIQL